MKDVLPLNTSGNLILRGTRVVVPKTHKDVKSSLHVKAIKVLWNQVAATREGLVSEHRQAVGERGKDVCRLSNRHS